MLVTAAFHILRHRRDCYNQSHKIEREFQYGGSPDLNAPNAGYYNSDPKKDIPPLEELYGSQEVRNHGETQELDSGRYVYEMGDGRELSVSEMARTFSDRDKKLPSLPSAVGSPISRPVSPSPVSPHYR